MRRVHCVIVVISIENNTFREKKVPFMRCGMSALIKIFSAVLKESYGWAANCEMMKEQKVNSRHQSTATGSFCVFVTVIFDQIPCLMVLRQSSNSVEEAALVNSFTSFVAATILRHMYNRSVTGFLFVYKAVICNIIKYKLTSFIISEVVLCS